MEQKPGLAGRSKQSSDWGIDVETAAHAMGLQIGAGHTFAFVGFALGGAAIQGLSGYAT